MRRTLLLDKHVVRLAVKPLSRKATKTQNPPLTYETTHLLRIHLNSTICANPERRSSAYALRPSTTWRTDATARYGMDRHGKARRYVPFSSISSALMDRMSSTIGSQAPPELLAS